MRNRSRTFASLVAVAFASIAFAYSAPASAEPAGVAFFIDAFTSFGRVDDDSLHVVALQTEPDPLKERSLRIGGGGNFYGGGLRLEILGKEARGGFGMGVFGVEGLELRHDPLPTGLSAEIGRSWGASFDAFVGRELLKGPVYPHVDLRATFTVIQQGVVLRHPDYGVLGETGYNSYSFGVGPRLGVSIPLKEPWVIDISGYYGLFGAQLATIVASIGFWDR